MNMAEAAAAATLQVSPAFRPPRPPSWSRQRREVPITATAAPTQVDASTAFLSRKYWKNGTSFTFKYKRKAEREAVVVSRATA